MIGSPAQARHRLPHAHDSAQTGLQGVIFDRSGKEIFRPQAQGLQPQGRLRLGCHHNHRNAPRLRMGFERLKRVHPQRQVQHDDIGPLHQGQAQRHLAIGGGQSLITRCGEFDLEDDAV